MGENDPTKVDWSKFFRPASKKKSHIVPLSHEMYTNAQYWWSQKQNRAAELAQSLWRAKMGPKVADWKQRRIAFERAKHDALLMIHRQVDDKWTLKNQVSEIRPNSDTRFLV